MKACLGIYTEQAFLLDLKKGAKLQTSECK